MKNLIEKILQKLKYLRWRIFYYRKLPKTLSLIRQTYPTLVAEQLISVQPMSSSLASDIMTIIDAGNYKKKPGDYGHEWLHGWYIVDENSKEVYHSQNEIKYSRLFEKYRNIKEDQKCL